MSRGEELIEKYKLISTYLGFECDQEVLVAFKNNPKLYSPLMSYRMKALETRRIELGL